MNAITEHFYPDREALFDALTDYCQQALSTACADNDSASFMISGGSTPAPLYQRLAACALPWQQIKVALVDERWVDKTSSSSNTAFAEKSLLQNNAADCQFVAMKTPAATAKEGLAQATANYQQLAQPFDLTILGMGGDGHTASLFPDAQGLEQALSLDNSNVLAAIMANRSEVTGDNLERITLSLYGLLQSRQMILLITGEQKLAVYRQALALTDVSKMPVSAVLQQDKVPLHVFWAP
ncbi:MAG: 6-phosphogluconolactonase [Phenylobacterium sp.]|jgi:6-phosphogluconolactonase